MKYAVTGATGGFGFSAITHLLEQGIPAGSITAVARSESKTGDLKALGVTVSLADYADTAALTSALKGVDRLLLVSGSEVGQRLNQHLNVIAAAKSAGVKRIAYTSLISADTSSNPLAEEHKATEAALKASGLDFVILRNNWYTENYAGDAAGAKQTGIITAAVTDGKVGSALRTEYAEAAARALTNDSSAGKTYELAGPLWTYRDFAKALSEVFGKPVVFRTITEAEKKASLMGFGLPEGTAGFYAALDTAIQAGSLAHTSGDLEKLLGRKPLVLENALKSMGV